MATYIHGDCLAEMAKLPDKSIDCFLCDLPFGILTTNSGKQKINPKTQAKYGKERSEGVWAGCAWDVKLDLPSFWLQVKRLVKNDNTPVIMFCTVRFGMDLIQSNPSWFRYELIWNKNGGTNFLSANKMPMKSHEMIYIFSKKGAYYKRADGPCPLTVINVPSSRNTPHPTTKPIELYKTLLQMYCPPGGTVLDPTAGSFNSITAAKQLKLRAIGIEKDSRFFWKAVARV